MTNQHPERPSGAGSNRQQVAIAATIGAILLLAIGLLGYSNFQKAQSLEESYAEINTVHTLHAELDDSYQLAIAELESMKGENAEMNTLIEAQKSELESMHSEIAVLLKDRKQLAKARRQLDEMKAQVNGYLAEIEQLKAEKMSLEETNGQLAIEKQDLFNNLNTQLMANTQLNEAKAQLVSHNEELSHAVKIGSVVKVQDVRAEGVKIRSNGKQADKRSASKVDQLNVCFTTLTNDVVQPGTEQFFVRIVNPRGETLAIESLGSGNIELEQSGDEIRFTQLAETEYQNDEQDLCLQWNPQMLFTSGEYLVEIYNKGYLAGTGNFELK